MNPFANKPIKPIPKPPTTGSIFKDTNIKENNTDIDFLLELKDFMNDFAESELDLKSIEDPATMTPSQANYFVKLYNELMEQKDKINILCDDELERTKTAINLFREKRITEIEKQASYFENVLKQYLLSETVGKKSKSVKLPYGTLAVRNMQPKYEYTNEEEILNFIKTLDNNFVNIKTVETIDKKALKKEGKVVDGKLYIGNVLIPNIEITEQEPKFEVKKTT